VSNKIILIHGAFIKKNHFKGVWLICRFIGFIVMTFAQLAAGASIAKPFFMEMTILTCWHILKNRNGEIF
jgi:hypothetical protein